jgi:hypothetical protein
MRGASDTPPAVERVLIEGFRRMTPAEKLQRVVALNRAVEQLASAGLRYRHGDMTERERRLRLAALRLDAELMRDAFGWDPQVHGL